jgi:hypothetical protein
VREQEVARQDRGRAREDIRVNDQTAAPALTADHVAQATRAHHYETADQIEAKGAAAVAFAEQTKVDVEALVEQLASDLRGKAQDALDQALAARESTKIAGDAARRNGDEIVQRVAESLEKSAQAREIAKQVAEHYAK